MNYQIKKKKKRRRIKTVGEKKTSKYLGILKVDSNEQMKMKEN